MKIRYFFVVTLLIICSSSHAQTPITVVVDDGQESLNEVAIRTLQNKANILLTANGLKTDIDFAQFVLQIQPVVTNKEVLTGMRPVVTMSMDMNISLLNRFTGQSIAGETFRLNGSGANENKAIIQASSSLNNNNTLLASFISNAEKKIITFYEQHMNSVIAQARLYATQRNYEQALMVLSSVPTACKNYAQAESALTSIYQQYVDYDGMMRLQKARSLWNASQNADAASEVASLLSGIDPNSSAWPQIEKLQSEIKARIGEEWTLQKKVYQDGIDIKKQRIEAAKQVGVAYGNHQQAQTYSNYWIR
jgi:hypothetical protein